jgi:hypothetical protein
MWMVLGFPRVDDPAGLAATDSVDVLLKGGVSEQALLVWRHAVSVRAFARMPTSQNRDMGDPATPPRILAQRVQELTIEAKCLGRKHNV